MSSDIELLVFDPARGAVVHARWLGGSATVVATRAILGRAPRETELGPQSWAGVLPSEVERIANASQVGGASPGEIARTAERFPVPPFVWLIVHDS